MDKSTLNRWIWFAVLYLAGITTVSLVALLIRWALN